MRARINICAKRRPVDTSFSKYPRSSSLNVTLYRFISTFPPMPMRNFTLAKGCRQFKNVGPLALLDQQIEMLDQMTAQALRADQQAVIRLAEVPGLGVDSGQQIVAEVGAEAQAFASAAQFASWVGTCPGKEESAGNNQSGRSPKGNRFLLRLFSQAAHAVVKKKNSHFQTVFRRLLPRLGYQSAIWAIAHRLSRLVWKILHHGVPYIEQGAATTAQAQSRRVRKMAQTLRKLGYQVEFPAHPVPSLM